MRYGLARELSDCDPIEFSYPRINAVNAVIDRIPKVPADLLAAVLQLRDGFVELVRLVELLPAGTDGGFPQMTLVDYENFARFGRQLLWCRMYFGELGGREDARALPSLIDRDQDRDGFERLQWMFTGTYALDQLIAFAKETVWNNLLQSRGLGCVSKLVRYTKRDAERMQGLVDQIEAMSWRWT
jgi:hypothetical protein